jgi:DUF2934 family protein
MAAPREKTPTSVPLQKVSQSGEPSAPQGSSPTSGTSTAPRPAPLREQTVSERARQASAPTTATTRKAPTHAEIEFVAYEIYLQRGNREGNALEDWLQAERKLMQAFGVARGESPEKSRAQSA